MPYHNPLMVANRILQLDHMTMGRVMFGMGPGLLPTDAEMIGIDIKSLRDKLTEVAEIIVPLLSGGEVTHETSWYKLNKARTHLRPYTRPHPEIAVASTKCFLAQVVACYLLGLYLAQVKGLKYGDEISQIMTELAAVPKAVQWVLDDADIVRKLARELVNAQSFLFLGRHVGYPVALEGALNLKELAYLHAEGFAGGELKHGPIAVLVVSVGASSESPSHSCTTRRSVSRPPWSSTVVSATDSGAFESRSIETCLPSARCPPTSHS